MYTIRAFNNAIVMPNTTHVQDVRSGYIQESTVSNYRANQQRGITMYGAREYASMFNTGQRGRLFLVSGSHARGKTFNIWLLPSEDRIVGMPWAVKDTVEVYGVVGGQPGWTESYGWLHRGKWEQDFAALVEKRKAEIEEYKARKEREKADAEEKERARVAQLLSSY